MTEEPVTVSDWIQFLISQKNQAYMHIIGLISFNLTIVLIGLWYWERLLVFGFTVLFVLSIFCVGAVLFILYHSNSNFNRSKILLDEIMDEKKINVKLIKKEWFEGRRERKEMFGDISIIAWKNIRNITITFGVGILGIGLFLMRFGTEVFEMTGIQWIGSIGLGILALGVAFHSIVISKESDKRVKDIANANFLRVLSTFEDRRIDLQHPQLGPYKHPILIWKALVDMKEAEELLDFCDIDLKHQGRLIDLMNHMFKYTIRYYVNLLSCEEIRHLLAISQIGLKIDDEYLGKKNELRGRIRTLLEEPQSVDINEDYIKGIKDFIFKDIEKLNFILYRDQIKEWYYSM